MRDQLSSWTDGPSKNAIGRSPSRFYALPHIPRGCRSVCSFGMTTAIANSRTMQVWRTSLEQGKPRMDRRELEGRLGDGLHPHGAGRGMSRGKSPAPAYRTRALALPRPSYIANGVVALERPVDR